MERDTGGEAGRTAGACGAGALGAGAGAAGAGVPAGAGVSTGAGEAAAGGVPGAADGLGEYVLVGGEDVPGPEAPGVPPHPARKRSAAAAGAAKPQRRPFALLITG
jgi:hypothetical protein